MLISIMMKPNNISFISLHSNVANFRPIDFMAKNVAY